MQRNRQAGTGWTQVHACGRTWVLHMQRNRLAGSGWQQEHSRKAAHASEEGGIYVCMWVGGDDGRMPAWMP
eukprot:359241-Chlamydomonas_euryale.AAC.4